MAGWKLKKFSLAGLSLLAAILLVACRPIDDQIAHYLAHGPTSVRPYVATGPSCTELEETAQETLANVRPPPAAARFSAADRKALAITAFGHLCELTREVGWRQSATAEESKAAELLMDRFTEFGYSPEMQNFQVRIGPSNRESRNIILELPGQGEGVVILGAHYDTVRNSVGANDNASGVSVLLTLAERLAQPPWSSQMISVFPFTLRIIAFGSEETGMSGSWNYVRQLTDEESDAIRVMINLDSVGSGTFLRGPGDRWLTRSCISSRQQRRECPIRASPRVTAVAIMSLSGTPPRFRLLVSSATTSHASTPEAIRLKFINPVLLGDTAVLVLVLLASLEDL